LPSCGWFSHSRMNLLPPAVRDDQSVWLRVGTLLDGTAAAPLRDAHVVYDRQAIRFVGTDGSTPPPEALRAGQNQPDLDAPDATLLPGLTDSHAHLFLEGGEPDPGKRTAFLQRRPEEFLALAHGRLGKLVRLGITAVRDAGDRHGVGLALQQQFFAPGRPLMPFIESPGAAIFHRGRYGSFMGGALEDYPSPRACVQARAAAGASRIKLIPTGIINFKAGAVTTEPQMTVAEIAEIAAAAKSCGRQTFAHASGDTGIDRVIEGGVDSVEHGYFVRDEQLARMRDRQTAWVPTFAPLQAQVDHAGLMGWDTVVVENLRRILDQHAASLVKAHELGVIIVAGSDAGSGGVPHGLGLLREMALMESVGLPPLAVIHAATGAGSARFAYRENFGRITPSRRSRFILTRHSPLETVANLRKPRTVVFDGEVLTAGANVDTLGL
ncbi:MAG: amidohydrolase family protein, partial [Verrucomicrobiota bacterium]